MKKSEEDRLKQAINESALSTADAVSLPRWERQRGGGFAAKKKANPASLRSAAPSKGRGSCGHSLLPMEGGAPKGRRLDGKSGMKKRGERSSQVRRLREHPIHRCAVPLPQWGRLTIRGSHQLIRPSGITPYIFEAKPPPSFPFLIRAELSLVIQGQHAL